MELKINCKVKIPNKKLNKPIDGENTSYIVSFAKNNNLEYLYFTGTKDNLYYLLHYNPRDFDEYANGDYFFLSDIELYEEKI